MGFNSGFKRLNDCCFYLIISRHKNNAIFFKFMWRMVGWDGGFIDRGDRAETGYRQWAW